VPKLLAVSHIISNPRKFGLDISWPPVRIEWIRLPVERQVDLRILADAAGVDTDELLRMNVELSSHITPSSDYMLKVRRSDADSVRSVLYNRGIQLVNSDTHNIRAGDTLAALSRHYGASVSQILSENPGLDPKALRIGMVINIPNPNKAPPYKSVNANYSPPAQPARPAPPPALTAAPSKAKTPEPPVEAAAAETLKDGVWTVKQGDTFWSIARRFSVPPETLARANGMLLSDALNIGHRLNVPISPPTPPL
jgi:membrane-bound lytic murein transglycosylase D